MSINSYISQNDEQYFTYETHNRNNRELHVIDADHGIFESKIRKEHSFSPKNLINKLKNNNNRKKNPNLSFLVESDDFKLRAEPELVDSYNSRNNSRHRNSMRQDSDPTPAYSSDNPSESDEYDRVIPEIDDPPTVNENSNSRYYLSQKAQPGEPTSKVYGKSMSTKKRFVLNGKRTLAASGMIPHLSEDGNPSMNALGQPLGKSQLEIEYEKMKIKAARYQAERDALHIKMKKREMAEKMRDYEYYCVNGISHKQLLRKLKTDEGPVYFQQPQIQEISTFSTTRRKTRSLEGKQNQNQMPFVRVELFDKLADAIPPSFIELVDFYAKYIPSIQSVSQFHKAVLIWISTMPIISLIYPVLLTLGLIIPKKSRRTWSLRSLLVAALDLIILFIYGCGVYKSVCWLYHVFNGFYKMGRFFGVI